MTKENQMDDLMLPLPEPFIGTKFVDGTNTAWDTFEFYTADQMREYAKLAVEAERAKRKPLTLWTEAQHERAYRNSPELHKDVKSLAAFKRVAKEIAAMYGITTLD